MGTNYVRRLSGAEFPVAARGVGNPVPEHRENRNGRGKRVLDADQAFAPAGKVDFPSGGRPEPVVRAYKPKKRQNARSDALFLVYPFGSSD